MVAAGIGASCLMMKEGYVDFEDVTYRPVINLKGIVELLMYYGYFEKTDKFSAIDYNNLVSELKVKNLGSRPYFITVAGENSPIIKKS